MEIGGGGGGGGGGRRRREEEEEELVNLLDNLFLSEELTKGGADSVTNCVCCKHLKGWSHSVAS